VPHARRRTPLAVPGAEGINTEIFTKPITTPAPLKMRISAVRDGNSGMGHLAITTKHPQQLRSYYTTVFDARISDFIDEKCQWADAEDSLPAGQ